MNTPRAIDTASLNMDLFWSKVEVGHPLACWEWGGRKDRQGYGDFGRKHWVAHRVAYVALKGDLGDLHVDHLCRNSSCVNPDHLEAVTNAENVRRGRSGAQQRSRTHCRQGHPYQGGNLYINPDGARECRQCRAAKVRRWRERNRP